MWDFEIMDGINFKFSNHVHPLMQKRVQNLLQNLSNDMNVKKIVLFGSSLEFRCNSNSDIDLYVEKEDVEVPLSANLDIDCEVDIVTNLDKDSNLYKEIMRKGLLLFERKNLCVM